MRDSHRVATQYKRPVSLNMATYLEPMISSPLPLETNFLSFGTDLFLPPLSKQSLSTQSIRILRILGSQPHRLVYIANQCLHHRVLPIMMLLEHVLDCLVDLPHISLSLLDRCCSVPFPLPSVDVVLELGKLPLLLLDVFAQFTVIRFLVGNVHQL